MRPYLCPICWSLRGEQIFYCKGEERSKNNLSERDAIFFFCQLLLKQSCRKWMNFCPIFVHCSCQGLGQETNFKQICNYFKNTESYKLSRAEHLQRNKECGKRFQAYSPWDESTQEVSRVRVFEFLMKVVNMFKRIINVTTSERFPFDTFYETKGQILCLRKWKGILLPEIYSMISEMSIFSHKAIDSGCTEVFLLPKLLGVLQVFMT